MQVALKQLSERIKLNSVEYRIYQENCEKSLKELKEILKQKQKTYQHKKMMFGYSDYDEFQRWDDKQEIILIEKIIAEKKSLKVA